MGNANQRTDNSTLNEKIALLSVLDLRQTKSIEELRNITEISRVGAILLSESFQGSLASIPMNRVGSIISLPDSSKVNMIGGTFKVGGKFLENPDVDGSDILLVTGELLITSPITKFGYKQLIVTGQLFVPRGCEHVLTPYIKQLSGEIIAYDHRNPRIFYGQGRFGADFFTYMKEPVTMIIMGEYVIEADVSVELIREKVNQIILMGVLKTAKKKLTPILQALTTDQWGLIQVSDRLEGEPHG